ncbi:MAG: threonylcarbamoyl-AMP synthase [Rhodocyclaceae bacterium]|nr:MAG: threonylcarbamoyl-AMP synthase [Rhodocyclaceae bacterium]
MRADQGAIDRAVALLQAGELVAFPTETVYGLGADAANPLAVGRIFSVKGRPADHPLIVHLPGADSIERWAQDVPACAWELAEAFWPGPLTLILRRAAAIPAIVCGGQETIGLRVPAHPVALALLRSYAAAGGGVYGLGGIAAPSANRFGRISPTAAEHVRDELGDAVSLILDGGRCQVGIESTIVDLSAGADGPLRLLRPGHVTPEQIAAVTGILPQSSDASAPRVSGSLAAHYAPATPLRLVSTPRLVSAVDDILRQGRRCALLHYSEVSATAVVDSARQLPPNPGGYGYALYAALRALDQSGVDVIVVEAIPSTPAWAAVGDRLQRAVCGSGAAGSAGQTP